MQKLETVTAKSERKKAVEQLNVIDRTRLQIPSFDEMDNGYKRLKYVRYADDFLIGVIGSKEDCQRIKEDIRNFLEPELKFEFSDEKTLITHSQKAVKSANFFPGRKNPVPVGLPGAGPRREEGFILGLSCSLPC